MSLLDTLRQHWYREFVLWPRFKAKAASDGYTTNEALARLTERYLARGFDDGRSESKQADKTADEATIPRPRR
jgi:hypothetical protein